MSAPGAAAPAAAAAPQSAAAAGAATSVVRQGVLELANLCGKLQHLRLARLERVVPLPQLGLRTAQGGTRALAQFHAPPRRPRTSASTLSTVCAAPTRWARLPCQSCACVRSAAPLAAAVTKPYPP